MRQLVTTGFGSATTAAEAIVGIDLSGRSVIVTGASSGIGVEAARALASAGATVTLAVRDVDAGDRTASAIRARHPQASVDVRHLDLLDRSSIAAFSSCWTGPLDVLINNAGAMGLPELTTTPDGVELQLATNHLGHFALTLGLHDALAAAGTARVVTVSSVTHRRSPLVLDDLSFARRPYDPTMAYGQSKTANVLFGVHASQLWASDGISANAVHPGPVVSTGLYRHLPAATVDHIAKNFAQRTIEQGAAGVVIAATAAELTGIGGLYLEDGNEAPVLDPSDLGSPEPGVAPHAVDPETAERLWTESLRLLR